jgi:hypothetical protein
VRFAASYLSIALSGRRLLMPATALILVAIGIYASRPDPVESSFAVTVVLSAPICAWIVTCVEREVGATADAILTVRTGGAVSAWRGRLILVGIVSVAITAFLVGLPITAGVFDRSIRLSDLVAATLSHLASCAFGGTLSLLLGPPVRTATASATIVGVMLASVALEPYGGILAGPGGVAHELSVSGPDTVSGSMLAACGIAFVEAATLALAARVLSRWRG